MRDVTLDTAKRTFVRFAIHSPSFPSTLALSLESRRYKRSLPMFHKKVSAPILTIRTVATDNGGLLLNP